MGLLGFFMALVRPASIWSCGRLSL